MKVQLLFLFCLVSIAVNSTQSSFIQTIDLPGSCPNLTFIALPFSAIAGNWYRPYSTIKLDGSSGCDGDCITSYIRPGTSRTYNMDVCCRVKRHVKCGASIGSGTLQHHPVILGAGSYTNLDKGSQEGAMRGLDILQSDYYILDTDDVEKPSYLIVYGCETFEPDGQREEVATVLTRMPNLTEVLITRVFNVFESIKFNTKKLIYSAQGDHCPYISFD